MLWITLLIPVTAAYSAHCPTVEDPCYRYNGLIEIPDMYTRHPSIEIGTGPYSQDVYKLGFGLWYISDFPMTSSEVENGHCGTKFPIWINGSTPGPADGIVNRTACVKDYDDACAATYTVLAKNCGYYYVYCFWDLPYADQRFCFDVDLSKVTTTTTTTTSTTTIKPTTTTTKSSSPMPRMEPYSERLSKQSADSTCNTERITLRVVSSVATLALVIIVVYLCQIKISKRNKVYENITSSTASLKQIMGNGKCAGIANAPSKGSELNSVDETFSSSAASMEHVLNPKGNKEYVAQNTPPVGTTIPKW